MVWNLKSASQNDNTPLLDVVYSNSDGKTKVNQPNEKSKRKTRLGEYGKTKRDKTAYVGHVNAVRFFSD